MCRTWRLDCDRQSGDELLLRLQRLDFDDVTDITASDFGGLCTPIVSNHV